MAPVISKILWGQSGANLVEYSRQTFSKKFNGKNTPKSGLKIKKVIILGVGLSFLVLHTYFLWLLSFPRYYGVKVGPTLKIMKKSRKTWTGHFIRNLKGNIH
jgi:hypothetical protein